MDPFRDAGSIFFVKMPSFCSKWYGRPANIGVTEYIELKNLIINWSKDNLKNTTFKWHIQSPYEYWQAVQEKNGWDIDQLKAYEDDMLDEIDAFLSSETAENAQKRFHSKFMVGEYGKDKQGWIITPLEDKTKENSTAYLEQMKYIDESIVAASHLDPALSNIQIQGSLSSGIDKLIAFNIHQLITAPTPRKLILSPVNEAIRVNFWKGDYRPRVGFLNIELDYLNKNSNNNQQTAVDSQKKNNNQQKKK
jgi:hypothetical protein